MENTINKPRYELLDGLRGVAAILVILYHFGEGFATSPVNQMMNHGYLAVDFFFVLSGFVLGYAYNNRLNSGNMSFKQFFIRRIIRLHPMLVISVLLGVVAFVIQGCVQWDGTSVNFTSILISTILGLCLIPVLPGYRAEIRGNGEMFPLVGPSWSLFFEYIGSFFYGLFLHRLSTKWMKLVVILSAIALTVCAFENISGGYSIGFGWSAGNFGWFAGFCRLSFSFSAGLLLQRIFKPRKIRGSFWICTAILTCIFACPYIGSEVSPANAVYDILCTLFVFPLVVYIGACGTTTDRATTATCDFVGQISYPIYIIHYPIMYLFYAWLWTNGYTFDQVWYYCIPIFFGIIILAWTAMRYYDTPVRRRLSQALAKNERK